MRDAGLVELRRDHPDIVRQRAADLGADLEPLRMDAVVVGDENAHALGWSGMEFGRGNVLPPRIYHSLAFVLRHPARSMVFKPPI